MGVVYKARQVSLNRIVAVKMLLFGKLAGDGFIKRFRAEAEAAASLQHANIVAIHEVGEHEGQPYFSMDYVEGTNLAALIKNEALPARRAAGYLRSVAEAIHYAHQRGVLHRDFKPSNLLIDANDQPRITDFGLAKRLQGEPDLTITGQVLGTPHYMPPEQAGGKRGEISVASDVYSLGAILYHALVGRPPFLADTLEGVLTQLLHNEPASPRLLNPTIPRDLETICLKCLNKKPAHRYESAVALADELGRWLNHEPIRARPITSAEKLWRWCRRKPAMAALAVALTLVAGAGLTGILWQWRRAEQHAASETTQRVRAEEALTLLELQRAEDLLEKDEVVMGVAYLARIVRQQPTNRVAAQRLLSALTQRNFSLPVSPPLQHNKKVPYAAFSPDGRRMVTVSLDFHARLWDARTGALLAPPMVHENAVRFAEFSPDGTRLLTFADDCRAYLWDGTNGHAIGRPMSHPKTINTAHFSLDGHRVVTASQDGTARVWDGRSGQPVSHATLRHQDAVSSASFSPDGKWIVTASRDRTAQVWDATTFQPRGKPFQHHSAVGAAEFSPDARWIITMDHDTTGLWDLTAAEPPAKAFALPARIHSARFSPDGGRILTAPMAGGAGIWKSPDLTSLAGPLSHRGQINSIEFGPEGQRILTGSHDNTARVWDAQSGEPLTPPMQHDGMVWSARFSPDGMFAVTASADQTARIWDVRLGGVRSAPMSHQAPLRAAEFSPDSEWVVTAAQDNTARMWNARTGQQRGSSMMHAAWVTAAEFSLDGQRVATASSDRTARIWDAATGQPLTEPLSHGANLDWARFSPDGRWLATASKVGNIVRLWNAHTGEPHGQPIQHERSVHFVSFSPDGRLLMSGDSKEDVAHVWEVASGKRLAQTPAREGQPSYGEFSPDGERLVTASQDGTARIFNARTGLPLIEPLRHKGIVHTARFSRDGRRVVTASDDTTARVWDAGTGQPMGEPLRHSDVVQRAEFSQDGTLVVTASDDGTARLWDARSGRPISEPFVHRDKVVSARFSPDGRHVLTASHDRNARVWDVPPVCPAIEQAGLPGEKTNESSALLLADLAETVIGKRVNAQGALESVSSARLGEVRQRLAKLPRDADFTRWLEWFFADRSTRNISPYSQVRMSDYIWSRAKETNQTSWREALMLCPTQGYAFAQLSKHHLRQSQTPASPAAAQADWASRQAVKCAPQDWWSWHFRGKVLEHTGAWTNLLMEADRVIQFQPDNHHAWNWKALAFEKNQTWDAAVVAFTRALELGDRKKRFDSEPLIRTEILLNRANALRQLGRMDEATADNLAGYRLAPRDPQAQRSLIDLSAFYNGGAPEDFPGVVLRLAGTDFDFRGWIHLDVRLINPDVTNLPERVNDIPIDRRCRRLHFLHTAVGSSYVSREGDGERVEKFRIPTGVAVGHYLIHYADGQQTDIPILHGLDVRDYWWFPESAPDDPALVAAWTGSSPHSRQKGATTRLYQSTWENPRPDTPIRSLDFVHGKTHAVPILVAITAE